MNTRLANAWPTLAIMIGASVWGLVWYPMRMLHAMGLTGTAASATTSGAAGVTSIGFVWGAIHGQVMRVLPLFYLTPAWTTIFAHFILRDRLTRADALLSLAGAITMLWSPALGLPLLAEWAG